MYLQPWLTVARGYTLAHKQREQQANIVCECLNDLAATEKTFMIKNYINCINRKDFFQCRLILSKIDMSWYLAPEVAFQAQ